MAVVVTVVRLCRAGPEWRHQHCDSGAGSGPGGRRTSGRPDHPRGQSHVRQRDAPHAGKPRPRGPGSQGGPAWAGEGGSLQAKEHWRPQQPGQPREVRLRVSQCGRHCCQWRTAYRHSGQSVRTLQWACPSLTLWLCRLSPAPATRTPQKISIPYQVTFTVPSHVKQSNQVALLQLYQDLPFFLITKNVQSKLEKKLHNL